MVEIVILGCGFSGMLTALALAKLGIRSTIIENRSVEAKEFYNDIRTTALTPYSQNFLDDILVWQELEEYVSPMLDVYVVDNKADKILHLLNGKEGNKVALGYIIKNSDFKKILVSKIQNHPYIKLFDKYEYKKIVSYTDHSTVLFESNKQINCDLLVICDGANSKARSYFFTNEIEKPYQTALTFNIKHQNAHENCAMEHFLPLGPFALLPMKDQDTSSVVWSTEREQASLLMNLPVEEFEYLVQRNCGKSLGKITIDSKVTAFPLKARIANRYYHNRIVLVADSAHAIHPLAGQGLNQGIKDISALADLINEIGISEPMLKQYQKLRQEDNFIMYKITDGLNSIFSNYSQSLHYLRQIGFKAIDKLRPIKNLITNYSTGER